MNKELETIIENEFDCLINDLGCLIGEEWKAEAIKKVVNQAFVLGGVSSSLPTKKYEIDFGTHLRCGIDVTDNELNILGAMDGWGNGVSKEVIEIKQL